MSQWISVKDRLPAIEEQVILSTSQEVCIGCMVKDYPIYDSKHETHYSRKYGWCMCEENGDYLEFEKITHWMPLPNLPEIENERA